MANEGESRPKCFVFCSKIMIMQQRYVVAILGCLGLINAYIMRQCLSPTITQLVLPRNYSSEQIKSEAVCEPSDDFSYAKPKGGTRDWSQELQSFILSSFYIGYIITHVPGGMLADKFGAKWILSIGILSTAIFTLLTPLAIEYGDAYGLITLRILMGLGEGPAFPALAVLMADWVPPNERGFLGSFVLGGGQLGSIIANSMSGWMLLHYEWHVVFYVWGIVAGIWCIFFTVFCYSSPSTHPCISDKEKQYLLEEVGDTASKRKNLPPTPFKAIFTSIPMWSLIAAQIGHDWAFYIILSYLPKYINDVLQIRIDKNGFLSSLPSLIMWACSIVSGIIADVLIISGLMAQTPVRKMMTGIAAFGPAIFVVAASYSGCDYVAVITNFCICMGLMGTYYGGMKLTPIDMSPNYAGMVTAITNGVGAFIGFIAPTTVGFVTHDTTIHQWRIVFWMAFTILVVSGVIYCIWAKSEIQPWNTPEPKEAKKAKDIKE